MWLIYILCGIILGGLGIYLVLNPKLQKRVEYNTSIENLNKYLELANDELSLKNRELMSQSTELSVDVEKLRTEYNMLSSHNTQLREDADATAKQFLDQAMYAARQSIDRDTKHMQAQYEMMRQQEQDSLDSLRVSVRLETESLMADITKLKATFEAAREASVREERIKANPADFKIAVSSGDIADIKKLYALCEELNNPRVLKMLIWSSYIKTPLDTLCDKIFGAKPVCGIYKITNLLTNEVYVGQTVDMKERMRQHFKRGLGIDTPANNKFYTNMMKYGPWNFSIELLEQCPREQLDEKEKFYINLYGADHSLNSTRGNN